jgi:hypothetical protein
MLKANDPTRESWISVAADSDFPIQNIPFGVFKTAEYNKFEYSENWLENLLISGSLNGIRS